MPHSCVSLTIAQVAREAAQEAGALALHEFGSLKTVDEHLPHDLKLELDRRCEAAILARIHESFPDHSIITEEAGEIAGSGNYTWYVDPIDGTVNYFHGLPHFCSSVACYRTNLATDASRVAPAANTSLPVLGTPVVGVVYAPALDLLFCGGPEADATVNGTALRRPALPSLSHAMVALAFTNRNGGADVMGKLATRMAKSAQKVRSVGATALDICLVASGRLGAFIQRGTNSWDLAAGCAVAQAAGCNVHLGPHQGGRHLLVVSQPELHHEIMSIVRTSTEEEWNAYALSS